jgi:hypothetical protein
MAVGFGAGSACRQSGAGPRRKLGDRESDARRQMVKTFFQDFKRDDGTDVTVEYFYKDHGTCACIKEAWRSEDVEGTELLELRDAEHERMTAWIMEHRSQDDQSDPG